MINMELSECKQVEWDLKISKGMKTMIEDLEEEIIKDLDILKDHNTKLVVVPSIWEAS